MKKEEKENNFVEQVKKEKNKEKTVENTEKNVNLTDKESKENKGNKKKHLSYEERFVIEKMLKKKESITNIAKVLERGISTISEEIKKGRVFNKKTGKYEYIAIKSHHKAYVRQYWKKKDSLIVLNISKQVRNEIEKRIIQGESPEVISGWIKNNENEKVKSNHVSPKAIRKYLDKSRPSLERFLFWNRNHKKSGPKRVKTSFLEDKERKTLITKYLIYSNADKELGHWEMDFIVSKHNSFVLLVLVERLTKKVLIKKLSTRKNDLVNKAISFLLKHEYVKSIVTDNDIAFSKWKDLEKILNIDVFFTQPFHSWEKGLVENTNRWIRQFIPKKTDLKLISDKYIRKIEDWLNNIPRKIINFQSPYEYYTLLKDNVKISSLIPELPEKIY